MSINAAAAKEAIEHLCNCLAYFGISHLNPEAFRQAKLGNLQVAERFWTGLFQLIVLHLHNFTIRGVQVPGDIQLVKHFVSYMLSKHSCPVPLFPEDSKCLLMALSFAVHYTDLFKHYDSKYALSPSPFGSIEELNVQAQEFLDEHLPKVDEVNHLTILTLYRSLTNQIHEAFKEIATTGYMIYALHEIDPSLEVEDLWVANAEDRLELYEAQAITEQNARKKQEKESRMRTTFWKWVDNVLESMDPVSDGPAQKGPTAPEFVGSAESVCGNLEALVNEVQQLWRAVTPLATSLQRKWAEVNAAISQQFAGSGEWTQLLDKVAHDSSQRFVLVTHLMDRLSQASNIPPAVSPVVAGKKDRSDGDSLLLKKLPKIQGELESLHRTVQSNCVKQIKKLPNVRAYNL